MKLSQRKHMCVYVCVHTSLSTWTLGVGLESEAGFGILFAFLNRFSRNAYKGRGLGKQWEDPPDGRNPGLYRAWLF